MILGSGAFPVGCRESGVDCHIHLLLLCAPFPLSRCTFRNPPRDGLRNVGNGRVAYNDFGT